MTRGQFVAERKPPVSGKTLPGPRGMFVEQVLSPVLSGLTEATSNSGLAGDAGGVWAPRYAAAMDMAMAIAAANALAVRLAHGCLK